MLKVAVSTSLRISSRSIPTRLLRPSISSSLSPKVILTPNPRFNSTSTTASQCPSCKAPLPPSSLASPLCPACQALLPPPPTSSITHYQLLDLPESYTVDRKEAKRAFLKLQQKVHPDRFSGGMEGWAKGWSTKANEALRVLESDLGRGEYLLKLKGIEVSETDNVTDPELLMSIMETREALEEAQSESDMLSIRSANTGTALLLTFVGAALTPLARIEEVERTTIELGQAFEEGRLEEAKNLVIKLRYLGNVEEVCKEWREGARVELKH